MIFKKAPPLAELVKPAPSLKTKLVIRYNCGLSNHLTIRGMGAGLSWELGQPLKNISEDLWLWESLTPFFHLDYKILLNDQLYEVGENNQLKTGQQIEHAPRFE